MKAILTIGLMVYSLALIAQTKIEKSIPVQTGQKLEFSFDFPELIRVHTWDKKEVLIKGTVSINQGENDNAFELTVNTKGNVVEIYSEIKDRNNLPKRTTIKIGEQEYYFKTGDMNDPSIQKFLEEHGNAYTYMSNGIIHEIILEIFIPKGMESRIHSKFGMVEITDFNAPLIVDAPHGGVDATIIGATTGQLTARTKFGEILTNLDTKFNSSGMESGHDHWTEVQANFGNGPRFEFESKFGKVYLRKPK
jgi:hypothetical protein